MDRVIVAAGVVVVDDAGRVLLVQRGHEPSRGRWSLPGGKVEAGETPAEAAAREVAEETGLIVDVGEELWSLTIPAGDGKVYEVHDFAAQVVGGELSSGDDAAAARWITPEVLGALPVTDGLLDHLARVGVTPSHTAAPVGRSVEERR